MSFRFLHAAEVHRDSPLRGLFRYCERLVEGRRSATPKANQVSFFTHHSHRVSVANVVVSAELHPE
jgi:hypothetical protein